MIQTTGYSKIKDERVMRACTGVDFARFDALVELFSAYYKKVKGICYFEMIKNLNIKEGIIFSDYRDIVFFVLYCTKVGSSFDVLGVNFGTNGATVHNNLRKFREVLNGALTEAGHAPIREIKDEEDMAKLVALGDKKIIDGTEMAIEKPKNKELRDKSYSVKKKRYCQKVTIISGKNKRIDFMGKLFWGSDHDYGMLKKEFSTAKNYFIACAVILDLAYLGFDKDYVFLSLLIPIKTPRKTKKNPKPTLTKEQKSFNKRVSQQRIFVENAISGLKRYQIISNRIRIKKQKYRDQTLLLCASLWNFYLVG